MPRSVRYLGESHRASDQVRGEAEPRGGYKMGGKVSSYPKISDGAGSGVGRIQKVRSYGVQPKGKP